MAAGNWVPELVELAGGINLFGEAGKHSPWMKFDDLVARDPDVILILPCGFTIQQTLEETHLLTGRSKQCAKSVSTLPTGIATLIDPDPELWNRSKSWLRLSVLGLESL